MIEVRGVTHLAAGRTLLDDLHLELEEPRVALIGANGSGKSTLARTLNGLIVPTRGEVLVDGLDTRTDGPAVRRRVGLVFQDPDLQIVLPTVAEDLAFGLRRRGLPPELIEPKVEEALGAAGLLEHRHHPSHLLSGGQKQLLATWSMLILEPAWMVLDEPTTLLDRRNSAMMTELILTLPMRVVIATHDLHLAERCERVIVLADGRIVADNTPDESIRCYEAMS